jgi:hypothetical protein
MSSTILYNQAFRLLNETLSFVDKLDVNPNPANEINKHQISNHLATLQKNISDLETLAKKEVTQVKKETSYSNLNKLKVELNALNNKFDNWKKLERDKRSEAERCELFQHDGPTQRHKPQQVLRSCIRKN